MPFNNIVKARYGNRFRGIPTFRSFRDASISSTDVEYCIGDTYQNPPAGPWTVSIPALQNNKYLWVRITDHYSDGTKATSYTYSYNSNRGYWQPLTSLNGVHPNENGEVSIDWKTQMQWFTRNVISHGKSSITVNFPDTNGYAFVTVQHKLSEGYSYSGDRMSIRVSNNQGEQEFFFYPSRSETRTITAFSQYWNHLTISVYVGDAPFADSDSVSLYATIISTTPSVLEAT